MLKMICCASLLSLFAASNLLASESQIHKCWFTSKKIDGSKSLTISGSIVPEDQEQDTGTYLTLEFPTVSSRDLSARVLVVGDYSVVTLHPRGYTAKIIKSTEFVAGEESRVAVAYNNYDYEMICLPRK